MLHCLGLPLFTTILPIASLFSENHLLHLTMVLLAIPVTSWVVFSELSSNRNELFIVTACSGLCLMLSAVLIPALEPFELILTVTGGILLGGAHMWRWSQHHARLPATHEDV